MNFSNQDHSSPSTRRSVLLAALVAIAMPIVAFDEPPAWLTGQRTWYTRVRHHTLVYYRAPAHTVPPLNELDPYDSFQKDDHGDLVIAETDQGIHSTYAGAEYRGYQLKTRNGDPVLVYQVTPTRRDRTKSNCHGFTFLAGDYWMMSDQVDLIIDGNHWSLVPREEVSPSDVAVYRDKRGKVVHTARVVGRNEKGQILVDSKDGFDTKIRGVWADSVIP